MGSTTIHLQRCQFGEPETLILDHGELKVRTFRYSTGVEAMRVSNRRGEIVLLPYQGQQIWSATFDARELTMRSMFTEPVATREFLATYGAFLVHCGFTAMGVPGPEDHHPLHGELPNAPYERVTVTVGADRDGEYVEVGGVYHHLVAFNHNYTAEPRVRVRPGSSLLELTMTAVNHKRTPMELMYMMHVNFRPVDNGRLVYSAAPKNVKTHVSLPSHMQASPTAAKLMEYMRSLEKDATGHHVLSPDLCFDPEIVFAIRYDADSEGWAHSMQVHPDGYASYIGHRPAELPVGVRWIARNADQDALGLVLPATAEHKGYTVAKRDGRIRVLAPGAKVTFHGVAGLLSPADAAAMETRIRAIPLT